VRKKKESSAFQRARRGKPHPLYLLRAITTVSGGRKENLGRKTCPRGGKKILPAGEERGKKVSPSSRGRKGESLFWEEKGGKRPHLFHLLLLRVREGKKLFFLSIEGGKKKTPGK